MATETFVTIKPTIIVRTDVDAKRIMDKITERLSVELSASKNIYESEALPMEAYERDRMIDEIMNILKGRTVEEAERVMDGVKEEFKRARL